MRIIARCIGGLKRNATNKASRGREFVCLSDSVICHEVDSLPDANMYPQRLQDCCQSRSLQIELQLGFREDVLTAMEHGLTAS